MKQNLLSSYDLSTGALKSEAPSFIDLPLLTYLPVLAGKNLHIRSPHSILWRPLISSCPRRMPSLLFTLQYFNISICLIQHLTSILFWELSLMNSHCLHRFGLSQLYPMEPFYAQWLDWSPFPFLDVINIWSLIYISLLHLSLLLNSFYRYSSLYRSALSP